MELNIDELEYIYEALSVSIADSVHLEVSRETREKIVSELRAIQAKVDAEVERLQSVQNPASK